MLDNQEIYHIYILSYGLNPYRDMSLQTLKILRESREIYVILTNPQLSAFLQFHGILYTDITSMYSEGFRREEIYNNIADFVIKRATHTRGICYLTYGNPMILDQPSKWIVERAENLGLSVYVVPSLSFIDVILAHLQLSIGSSGYSMHEATSLVIDRLVIDSRVPYFIAQVGAFRNAYATGQTANKQEVFYPLVDYLRRFYPANHMVFLCDSDEFGQNLLHCEVPLCLLPLLADGITYSSTLYIPAMKR